MSSRHRLQALLAHPGIWQAAAPAFAGESVLATGSAELDQALAGGWPAHGLCELLVETAGVGEFRLLTPVLGGLQKAARAAGRPAGIMFINPPYVPYAPALLGAGVDIAQVLVTRCHQDRDLFWTMEQALRSGACAAAVAWCAAADHRYLRRLQLAAETGRCWAALFRPVHFRRQSSPAALRLCLAPAPADALSVEIFKHRGSRPRRVIVAN
jgi:cell division inhibitor SulA/protein ImuA